MKKHGAPDAAATPSPSGRATKDTLIAAKKSERKLGIIPFHPDSGTSCTSIFQRVGLLRSEYIEIKAYKGYMQVFIVGNVLRYI